MPLKKSFFSLNQSSHTKKKKKKPNSLQNQEPQERLYMELPNTLHAFETS